MKIADCMNLIHASLCFRSYQPRQIAISQKKNRIPATEKASGACFTGNFMRLNEERIKRIRALACGPCRKRIRQKCKTRAHFSLLANHEIERPPDGNEYFAEYISKILSLAIRMTSVLSAMRLVHWIVQRVCRAAPDEPSSHDSCETIIKAVA